MASPRVARGMHHRPPYRARLMHCRPMPRPSGRVARQMHHRPASHLPLPDHQTITTGRALRVAMPSGRHLPTHATGRAAGLPWGGAPIIRPSAKGGKPMAAAAPMGWRKLALRPSGRVASHRLESTPLAAPMGWHGVALKPCAMGWQGGRPDHRQGWRDGIG